MGQGLSLGWIDVDVRTATGEMPPYGVVYAVPVGAGGADDARSLPHAQLPEACRIPITREGLYDVGFADGKSFAMVRDVFVRLGDVSRTSIRLPALAPIVFRWEPPPDIVPGQEIVARLGLRPLGGSARFAPGRGEQGYPYRGGTSLTTAAKEVRTEPMPCGCSYEISAAVAQYENEGDVIWQIESPLYDVDASPSVAAPGDVVHLRLVPLVPVRVSFQVAPDEWPEGPVRLSVEVASGRHRHGIQRSFGSPVQLLNGPSGLGAVVLGARPGPARLAWSGQPVLAESVNLLIPEAGMVQREVTLRCDPRMSPSASPVFVVIEGAPDAGEAAHNAVQLHGIAPGLAGAGEADLQADVMPGGPVALPANLRPASSVIGTCGEEWVSDPTPLAAGQVRIRLRASSPVVVLFEAPMPEAAGEVVIRARDGRPFSLGGGFVEASSVALGDVITWLPEGRHVFEVTVGGAPWPDAATVVRAGKVATLLIRQ